MPKERLHHGKIYETLPKKEGQDWQEIVEYDGHPSPTGPLDQRPSLDIHWGMGDHVQISMDISRDLWVATAKEVGDDDTLLSRAMFTDALSRSEINNMIKILRRARDATFGRDE